jgi:hypothetical protein
VAILNNRSISISETGVRNGIESWKTLLLPSAERQEVFVVFNSAISEGLQLHSRI